MKNLLKTCLAVVLVLSMIFACSSVGMAASYGDGEIRVSPVRFTADSEGKIIASSFVRNQGTAKSASLFCAVYEGNMLVDVKSAEGSNKILTTEAIDASGKVLKAFVWDSASLKVISDIATYNSTDVFESVKLTVDGVDFAEYVDETTVDLSVDGNYTKTLDGSNAKLPKDFKVEGNNGLTVYATTDEGALVTTIKVGYGLTTSTTSEGSIRLEGNKGTLTEYLIPEKTYTITYKVDGIPVSSVAERNTNVVGWVLYSKIYKKSYPAPTGDAKTTTVTVNLGKTHTRSPIIVVQPSGGRATDKPFNDIIVQQDGNPYTDLKMDSSGSMRYTYSGVNQAPTVVGGSLAWQKAVNLVEINGAPASGFCVESDFHSSNSSSTGSRTAWGANPQYTAATRKSIVDTAIVGEESTDFTGEFAPLSGGQYIPLVDSNNSIDTVEFYVNQAVDVYVIDGSDFKIATLSDWDCTEVTNSTVFMTIQSAYNTVLVNGVETASAMPIAWAVEKGYITQDEADRAFMYNGQWIMVYQGAASDVKRLTYNGSHNPADAPSAYKFTDGNIESSRVIYDVNVYGNEKGYKLADFDVTPCVINNSALINAGKFSVYSDKTDGFGYLSHYPAVFNMKGADVLTFPLAQLFNEEWSISNKKYYDFKVSCDAEVMVFAARTNACYSTMTTETGWTDTTLGYWDLIVQRDTKDPYQYVSIKEYKKGDTVEIYSPKAGGTYFVVVRPID